MAYRRAMAFNAPQLILPLYTRAPAEPSLARRSAFVVAQVAAAAAYGFAAVALPPQMLFVLILPVVVCLLAALWLMPDRGVFPQTAVQRSYRILFILSFIWPSYIAIVLPGLPWLTPTRIALFATSFLFLYSVSTSGQLRRHLGVVARASPLLWAAFLLWEGSMFVTVPFSHTLAPTFKLLIDNQLRLAGVFFVGCVVFARRGYSTRTVVWLLVLAVICALDGFVEDKLEFPPWANHIPSFMRVDDATLANVLGRQARSADGLYRVRGPYGNSLIFAEFLAMCMPFVLHWTLTARTLLRRVATAVAGLMIFGAIVITQSRLGLVGTMVAVATYVPLWAYRQWRADRTSLIGPTILFGAPLVALAMFGVVLSSHTLRTRVLGGGAQQASTEARNQQMRLAIPKVLANPIGHGLGQSGSALGFYNQAGALTVDNYYVTEGLDLGVVGTLGFFGMFVVGAAIGVRLYLTTDDRETELAGAMSALFAIFLVTKLALSEDNNHPVVFLFLGMLAALFARERRLIDPDHLFPRVRVPRYEALPPAVAGSPGYHRDR